MGRQFEQHPQWSSKEQRMHVAADASAPFPRQMPVPARLHKSYLRLHQASALATSIAQVRSFGKTAGPNLNYAKTIRHAECSRKGHAASTVSPALEEAHPNTSRCATSRHCQYSSGLNVVRMSNACMTRKRTATASTPWTPSSIFIFIFNEQLSNCSSQMVLHVTRQLPLALTIPATSFGRHLPHLGVASGDAVCGELAVFTCRDVLVLRCPPEANPA